MNISMLPRAYDYYFSISALRCQSLENVMLQKMGLFHHSRNLNIPSQFLSRQSHDQSSQQSLYPKPLGARVSDIPWLDALIPFGAYMIY